MTGTVVLVATVAITHEAFLLPHGAALMDAGHRVVGVARGLPGSRAANEVYDATYDLPIQRSPKPEDLVPSAQAIRQIALEEHADVVWLHTPLASAAGRLGLVGTRHRGIAVAYTAHGFHFGSVSRSRISKAYHAVEWGLSFVTDHLITVNREDYELALALPRRSPVNTEMTPGVGIDLARFERARKERDASRARLGIGDHETAVFIVGELNPEKRVPDALQAMTRMGAETRLFVVGSGPLRARLEAHAALISNVRVEFLGFRPDLPEVLSAADVLLHPSSREGLPTVVLEAQAMGIPVVGAAARGTAELLAGGAGLTFPVGDVSAMLAQLRRATHDGELREQIIERGRERAADHRLELATAASVRTIGELVKRVHRTAMA